MKQSVKTFFPAFLVMMAGVVLLGSYYLRIPVMHMSFMQGLQLKGNDLFDKIAKLLGDGAILLGAASFSWFIFKKKIKTSPKLIKETGKKVYHFHTYFGWTALVLVVLHGGYFLLTDPNNRYILTGMAAFLILACIAAYGFSIKKFMNKYIKKVHFILTGAWLVTLLIHGGGLVIASSGALLSLYIFLSMVQAIFAGRTSSKPKQQAPRINKI